MASPLPSSSPAHPLYLHSCALITCVSAYSGSQLSNPSPRPTTSYGNGHRSDTSHVPTRTQLSFLFLKLLSSTISNIQFSLIRYTLIFAYFPPADLLSFLRRRKMDFCVKSRLSQKDKYVLSPKHSVLWNCLNRIRTLESLLPRFSYVHFVLGDGL